MAQLSTLVALSFAAATTALAPAEPAAPGTPGVAPAAPVTPGSPVFPTALPELKGDPAKQLLAFLNAKPEAASAAMVTPAKPFYYPYKNGGVSKAFSASMMATYHTDMMALMYVYSFFIAAQKLAVDAGGYLPGKGYRHPLLPDKDTMKGAKGAASMVTDKKVSAKSLEKQTLEGLNMMQNPFALFWHKPDGIYKKEEHKTEKPLVEKSLSLDKKAAKSKATKHETSFLETGAGLAPAAPLPPVEKSASGKPESLLKHLDAELLDAERDGKSLIPKLSVSTIMSIQSIYFDVIANFHIVMAQLWSMPGAFMALKKPTVKAYITFTKIMAFYYWAGVQYFVDILDIQVLAGFAKIDPRPFDAYALRLKQYAFIMWYWEAIIILYELKVPTKANLVDYLKNMDSFKLCHLAFTCNFFGFLSEAGVKGAAGLSKMIPALGLMFAYTAFHQDFITYIMA